MTFFGISNFLGYQVNEMRPSYAKGIEYGHMRIEMY